MKILIAPLNWGLGHASRCIPLIQQWLNEGHEVVLGGDGDSLLLLRRHFPQLRFCPLASLRLQYSKSNSQVWAIARSIPHIITWAIKDYIMLRALLQTEIFDRIISDNRFGFYSKKVESIYLTHQLHIRLPNGWRWAESIATRLHARVYARYNKVWVPDRKGDENRLAGELSILSHREIKSYHLDSKIESSKAEDDYLNNVDGYKKVIDIKKEEDKLYILNFEGIMMKASLYINKHLVNESVLGYIDFTTDITKYLLDGENEIIVLVDSRESVNVTPFGGLIDYATFGGIYREAQFLIKNKTYIKNVKATYYNEKLLVELFTNNSNYNKYNELTNDLNSKKIGESIAICMGDLGLYEANQMIAKNYKDDSKLGDV